MSSITERFNFPRVDKGLEPRGLSEGVLFVDERMQAFRNMKNRGVFRELYGAIRLAKRGKIAGSFDPYLEIDLSRSEEGLVPVLSVRLDPYIGSDNKLKSRLVQVEMTPGAINLRYLEQYGEQHVLHARGFPFGSLRRGDLRNSLFSIFSKNIEPTEDFRNGTDLATLTGSSENSQTARPVLLRRSWRGVVASVGTTTAPK